MNDNAASESQQSRPLTFIRRAHDFYGSLFADLRAARQTVRIQMYCVEEGAAAAEFKACLVECARRGVDVELMYDSVGSMYTHASYFSEMERAGVRVSEYHPARVFSFFGRASFRRLFRRNHRKLVVIDSHIYYVGGMNIGDRFLEWEDIMVRGEGEPAGKLAASFDRVWGRRKIDHHKSRRSRIKSRMLSDIQVWDSRPAVDNYPVKRLYMSAIKKAKKRVWIAQAYFVPRRRLLKALMHAANKGVDVRLVIPDVSDVKLVDMAAWPSLAKLAENGVKVYRFTRSVLHTKMALIDDRWLSIGTANLDSMSMYWNLEINLVMRGGGALKNGEEIFSDYFAQSRLMDPEEPKQRPLPLRILGLLLHYYGWIL
ncbi:MAG: hypothetical protein HZB29_09990 [Nitrospinae bacterium]|nr:hypothetical protein [Nitrospinota bacterium]